MKLGVGLKTKNVMDQAKFVLSVFLFFVSSIQQYSVPVLEMLPLHRGTSQMKKIFLTIDC